MRNLSAPKGMRDFPPRSMKLRNQVIEVIEQVFINHGFEKWEGPGVEYLETLTAKTGENVINEIYAFKDKAGRNIGLRFELTSQLARIIANNPTLKKPIKAYSYGKVWRYENTQQGRYREFMQMDVDIIGSKSLLCEVELFNIVKSVFSSLQLNYEILINNRKLLEGILLNKGIQNEKIQDTIRSIDKLEKIPADKIKDELKSNGIEESKAKNLLNFFITLKKQKPDFEYIQKILTEEKNNQEGIKLINEGLEELKSVFKYWNSLGNKELTLDLRLARGLDYYTGNVFEVKIIDQNSGSVVGGGRYDHLIEIFSGKEEPAIGLSFGIERIIDIIEKKSDVKNKLLKGRPKTLIAFLNKDQIEEALKIAEFLRNKNLIIDLDLLERNLTKQINYAISTECDYVIILEQNLEDNSNLSEENIEKIDISLKELKTGEQTKLSLKKAINIISRS